MARKKLISEKEITVTYTDEHWARIQSLVVDLYYSGKSKSKRYSKKEISAEFLHKIQSPLFKKSLENIAAKFIFHCNSPKALSLRDLNRNLQTLSKKLDAFTKYLKADQNGMGTLFNLIDDNSIEKPRAYIEHTIKSAINTLSNLNPTIRTKLRHVGFFNPDLKFRKREVHAFLAQNAVSCIAQNIEWSKIKPNTSVYIWEENKSPFLCFVEALRPDPKEISSPELFVKAIGANKLKDYISEAVDYETYWWDTSHERAEPH